jgi:hypothetical protein
MTRAKHLAILERINRCGFCGREAEVSPLGYRENPFCKECLPMRLSQAAALRGAVECRLVGDYVEFVRPDARTHR